MAVLSLDERLNQIEAKISEKSFRKNKGLGNEVGYYIFDYDPKEEINVRNHIQYLKGRINSGKMDFKILEFDLFHLNIKRSHPQLLPKGFLCRTFESISEETNLLAL